MSRSRPQSCARAVRDGTIVRTSRRTPGGDTHATRPSRASSASARSTFARAGAGARERARVSLQRIHVVVDARVGESGARAEIRGHDAEEPVCVRCAPRRRAMSGSPCAERSGKTRRFERLWIFRERRRRERLPLLAPAALLLSRGFVIISLRCWQYLFGGLVGLCCQELPSSRCTPSVKR